MPQPLSLALSALCLIGLAGSAIAQEAPPPLDRTALAPLLSHSWVEGGSCAAPGAVIDWVIDTDGTPYQRSENYEQLTSLVKVGDGFSSVSEIDVGRTENDYRLQSDGTLRLWAERSFFIGDNDNDPPSVLVKSGRVVLDDEGKALNPGRETPALRPCPVRTAMFPAATIAALDGTWAMKGGVCASDAATVLFDLRRPIPHVTHGKAGEQEAFDGFAIAIVRDGKTWSVTEGSAMEATVYRYAENGDGTLTMSSDDSGLRPTVLRRCP